MAISWVRGNARATVLGDRRPPPRPLGGSSSPAGFLRQAPTKPGGHRIGANCVSGHVQATGATIVLSHPRRFSTSLVSTRLKRSHASCTASSASLREHADALSGRSPDWAPYRVMAFIYLPSLRTSEQVGRLQVGLARALARGFAVAPGEVLVVTSIIESGHVVEGGETQAW